MYVLYPDKRNEIADILTDYFRPITPHEFKAEAVVKYPKLNNESACSMHAEDIVTENLGLKPARKVSDGKVIKIIL
jgi:hypothetical protein